MDTPSTGSEQQVRRRSVSPSLDSSLDEAVCEILVPHPAVMNEVGEQALLLPNTLF